MVAAWIKAETGVGPAIASGNHVYKGICALLPVAPTNNKSVMMIRSFLSRAGAFANTSVKVTDPTFEMIQNNAIRKARSPIRFMIKAFFAAFVKSLFLNQYPINR